GGAHLEGFGGLEGVRRAKGEILEGLSASGTAVLNMDDPAFSQWRAQAQGQRVLRSEEHTSELQSRENLVCRLLLEKKNARSLHPSVGWRGAGVGRGSGGDAVLASRSVRPRRGRYRCVRRRRVRQWYVHRVTDLQHR